MTQQLIDAKLKRLVQLCKETSNYRKLAYVSYILVANKAEEVIVQLGVRFRERKNEEKVFSYMEIVNKVFRDNLKIEIFPESMISIIRKIELLLEKTDEEGEFFKPLIKDMFDIYYELRAFEIPDLGQYIQDAETITSKPLSMLSFFSGSRAQREKQGMVRSLLIHKLTQEEKSLQNQLKQEYGKESFEKLIQIQSIKHSLYNSKHKIKINGTLKENINYYQHRQGKEIYTLYGIAVALLFIAIVCITQILLFGLFTPELSYTLLICFSIIIGLFIVHKTLYKTTR